jgi:hypothetical protein
LEEMICANCGLPGDEVDLKSGSLRIRKAGSVRNVELGCRWRRSGRLEQEVEGSELEITRRRWMTMRYRVNVHRLRKESASEMESERNRQTPGQNQILFITF